MCILKAKRLIALNLIKKTSIHTWIKEMASVMALEKCTCLLLNKQDAFKEI